MIIKIKVEKAKNIRSLFIAKIREIEAAGDKTTGELTMSGVVFTMDNSQVNKRID